MFRNAGSYWHRRLLGLTTLTLLLLLSTLASAAGRIEWGSKTIKPRSDGNSWNIEIKIFLPKPPDVASLPMKFIFEQKVYYERALVDGKDGPIKRDVPITGKQPIVEGVDVGFLDPGSGKIENRTRYTFKIHRDHGFDCGEYKVVVRDARSDQTIGTPTTLILGGENEVIDRRAIVFTGEKKKKVESKAVEGAAGAPGTAAAKPAPSNEVPPEETKATEAAEPGNPAEIKQKPGGCGCRLGADSNRVDGAMLLLAGLALVAGRRFSRRRAQ